MGTVAGSNPAPRTNSKGSIHPRCTLGLPPAMLGPLTLAVVTYYCACAICCGQWSGSPTSSGVWPEPGWTIACPRALTARRALLWIEGLGVRQCEDTGRAINGRRIDVYVETHAEATRRGRHTAHVRELGKVVDSGRAGSSEVSATRDHVHARKADRVDQARERAAIGQAGAGGASAQAGHAPHAHAGARGGEPAARALGNRGRAKVSP